MDNIIAIIFWGAFALFSLFMSTIGVYFASWVKKHGADKMMRIIGMMVATLVIIWGIVFFIYSTYNVFSFL